MVVCLTETKNTFAYAAVRPWTRIGHSLSMWAAVRGSWRSLASTSVFSSRISGPGAGRLRYLSLDRCSSAAQFTTLPPLVLLLKRNPVTNLWNCVNIANSIYLNYRELTSGSREGVDYAGHIVGFAFGCVPPPFERASVVPRPSLAPVLVVL